MRSSMPLIAFLPLTSAFSWAHTSLWKKGGPQGTISAEDVPAPEEVALILQASESLDKYAAKPDCFRKAAALIRTSCNELETREDQRVKAALSMTLCEIATAEHHSPPMECLSFHAGYSGQPPHYTDGPPGKCVEALSRSAQYWSSYSGYLREVPQLCFAFRRWNDIDLAKELHRNTTLQALSLLRYFSDREGRFDQTMNESGALVESMRVILHDLQSSSATIYAASNDVSQQLRHTLDEMGVAFRHTVLRTQQEAAGMHAADLAMIQANVEGALHELVAATSALAPAIYEALSVNVERVSSLMTTRLQNINELSDRAGSQIMNLENHLEDMQRDVRLLIGDTWVAGDLLQVHLRQSVTTQEKQLEIARSTDNVAAALNRIVDKAHAEILQINDTAAAMKESLLKSSSNDWSVVTWSWLEAALMYSFRYLWKDDHAPLQLPGVHALVFFSRVVWWFLGLTSSGLMSVLVLLASRRTLYNRHCEDSADRGLSRVPPVPLSPQKRYPGSLVANYSTGSMGAVTGAPIPGSTVGGFTAATYPQRRRRISRIPDRLCRPSPG